MPPDPRHVEDEQLLEPIEDAPAVDADFPVRGRALAPIRQRSTDARLAALTSVVALGVALAILKPWGVAAPQPTVRPRPVVVASPTLLPSPTRDLSPAGLASPICLSAGSWQITSRERWRTSDVQVWRAIEPATDIADPRDPTIPSAPVVALEVESLGWCAPAYGPHVPVGPADVTVWTVRDGIATVLPLLRVQPATGTTQIAALYRPAATCAGQATCAPGLPPELRGAWVTSRIVFRYLDVGAGTKAWFAADVEIVASDVVVPAPT